MIDFAGAGFVGDGHRHLEHFAFGRGLGVEFHWSRLMGERGTERYRPRIHFRGERFHHLVMGIGIRYSSHFPLAAILAGEPFRVAAADERVLFRIPFHSGAVVIGKVHEMAGNHAAGADGNIADRRLPGLHRGQPVGEMVRAVVEPDLGVREILTLGGRHFPADRGVFNGVLVPELVDRFALEDEFEFAAADMDFAVLAEEGYPTAFAVVGERNAVRIFPCRSGPRRCACWVAFPRSRDAKGK